MAKITISRPQKAQLKIQKGKIVIDGTEADRIKAGETKTIEVPGGMHTIQACFSDMNSNPVTITDSDGDVSLRIQINIKFGGAGANDSVELIKE